MNKWVYYASILLNGTSIFFNTLALSLNKTKNVNASILLIVLSILMIAFLFFSRPKN